MIFFKKSLSVSRQASKWLIGYFVLNLLIIGSIFRIYLHKKIDKTLPWAQEFLGSLDQGLVYSFWLLTFLSIVFSIIFVQTYFSPLGSLIGKATAIKRGDFSIADSDIVKESRGEWYQLDLLLNKIWKSLKRKKAEVAKERGELEAVMTAASDAILAVDSEMNIKYYNAPMALLFEQKEEGILDKKLTEVIRNQKIIEGFTHTIKEQSSQLVQAQQEMAVDSSNHHFKVSISPFFDEKKTRVRGAVAIFHDITDLKKVEKVRMDFVANASHELKTPLTSVKGYVGYIKDQCKDMTGLIESFDIVEKNIERLNHLINDLLNLSKIESSELVNTEELITDEFTESVAQELRRRAEEKGQELSFLYEIKIVRANKELLEHVVVNLLENAIKYSPEQARIKIHWGEEGGSCFLSIKDNGPGIESYHQGRLFERFFRVRDEKNKNTRGTGLGLSIVRNCMQKMNGSVDVKSAPGLGSEFICYFPKS